MQIIMNSQGCPICGYKEIAVLDEYGCTTFEICDSCGNESGYSYDQNSSEEHLEKHRKEWVLINKCTWWSTVSKPPGGWDPVEQMKQAGIEKPK